MCMSHVTRTNESCHTQCVWRDSIECVTLVIMYAIYECCSKLMKESCTMYEWVMSHTCHVWMRHGYVTRTLWVLLNICMSDVTHMWMRHGTRISHMNGSRSCHTEALCVLLNIWTNHVTHINESCHTYITYDWVTVMSHGSLMSAVKHRY